MSKEELSRLVSGLLDGQLGIEQQAQLESILERDPEARRFYMQYVDLEVELSSIPIPTAVPAAPRRVWWQLAAAAVFVLLLSLGIALVNRSGNRPTTERWHADFERARPEGWVGLWTTNAAPGATGALTSITVTNSGVVLHQLRSPERWDEGLFTIHEDTHLHFIYRVETPKWFDMFFATRSRNPAEPEVVLHIFRDQRLWSPASRWQHATMPLSLFKRKVDGRFADVPPVAGEAPFQLFFSAEENGLQLTLDRIWVTRGGPGQLEINEVK